MKHFAFPFLFFLIGISSTTAQRKWEAGLAVQAGNYILPSDNNTVSISNTYSDRQRISAGICTSLGFYVQRRIGRHLAISSGLGYAMNQYEIRRDARYISDGTVLADQTWTLNGTEYDLMLPLKAHLVVGRWSFGVGATGSYHVKSNVESSYTNHLQIIERFPIIWCGTGYNWQSPIARKLQCLWSGALEYGLGGSTRIGVNALWSFKKTDPSIMNLYYSESVGWNLKERLPIFPRSLVVSLRHNLLR